eukprot:5518487-Pyramimonas_sp.AAC.1
MPWPNTRDLCTLFRALSTPDQQWVPRACLVNVAHQKWSWRPATTLAYLDAVIDASWVLTEGELLFYCDGVNDREYAAAVLEAFMRGPAHAASRHS